MELVQAARRVKRVLVRRLVIEQEAYKTAEAETKRELKSYFNSVRAEYLKKSALLTALHDELAEARNTKAVNKAELAELMEILRREVTSNEEELKRILETALVTGYNLGGRRAIILLGTRGSFELRNEAIMKFLRKHAAERVTRIDTFTRERISRIIIKAADDGVGMPGVYRGLRRQFEHFGTKRARTIARTELAFASGQARQEVFRRSRAKMHEWVTAQDELVGLGHSSCIDNEAAGPVKVGSAFPSGVTAEPAHPNCRCTTMPVVSEDFEPSDLWDGS